ncbi:MAG: hypothetical protein R3336_04425 [Phycisphaeraceae bacterium]|nr:hypothetical protein [Phycisphaeraceae bacterium]
MGENETAEEPTCELCERTGVRLTRHHLVPQLITRRRRKRKMSREEADEGPVANLCPACHRMIHATFSEQELAEALNTVERLLAAPQIARFVRWVKKQRPGKRVSIRRSRRR